jgi:hypothetical protein
MSEQDNLEVVQRAYDVFAKGDLLRCWTSRPVMWNGISIVPMRAFRERNTFGMDGTES